MPKLTVFDKVFAGSKGVAETLLGVFGVKTGEITLPGAETYNPATDTKTTNPEIVIPVKASPPSDYSVQEIDGKNILRSDMKVDVGASVLTAYTPEDIETGKYTFGSNVFTIVKANPQYSGELIANYELQVRK